MRNAFTHGYMHSINLLITDISFVSIFCHLKIQVYAMGVPLYLYLYYMGQFIKIEFARLLSKNAITTHISTHKGILFSAQQHHFLYQQQILVFVFFFNFCHLMGVLSYFTSISFALPRCYWLAQSVEHEILHYLDNL